MEQHENGEKVVDGGEGEENEEMLVLDLTGEPQDGIGVNYELPPSLTVLFPSQENSFCSSSYFLLVPLISSPSHLAFHVFCLGGRTKKELDLTNTKCKKLENLTNLPNLRVFLSFPFSVVPIFDGRLTGEHIETDVETKLHYPNRELGCAGQLDNSRPLRQPNHQS
jgi:hypothetical protein